MKNGYQKKVLNKLNQSDSTEIAYALSFTLDNYRNEYGLSDKDFSENMLYNILSDYLEYGTADVGRYLPRGAEDMAEHVDPDEIVEKFYSELSGGSEIGDKTLGY